MQTGDHILHLNLTGSYVMNGETMKVVAGICDLTVIRLFEHFHKCGCMSRQANQSIFVFLQLYPLLMTSSG